MKKKIKQKEYDEKIFDKTYHKLYLEERDKRLAPFNIPELLKEKENAGVTRLSDLGVDIPKAGDLEQEYFSKAMKERNSEVMAVTDRTVELYGEVFDKENYDHDEYLKDKELEGKAKGFIRIEKKIEEK